MANTEALVISDLNSGHLAGALELSREAGWNQVGADWLLMMKHGQAIGAQMQDGGPLVGSAIALPFGRDLAWISMVIVTASCRGKGIASRLVTRCLEWLDARGTQAVLDATPDGANVYRPLGFDTVRHITRWRHAGGAKPERSAQLRALNAADRPWIAALDKATFGAEREFVLADLMRRDRAVGLATGDNDGFLLSRAGRVATLIGPVTAQDSGAALDLLECALGRIGGPLLIDAFDDQTAFGSRLEALGFTKQRRFERMVRGANKHFGDPARSFAAAGAELG
jgi:ribosomal protein S18 acetylase RimI-like enzyme